MEHNHGDANTWFLFWSWDPIVIASILLLVGVYLYAVGPYRIKRRKPAEGMRIFAYMLGIILLFIATITPLNALAHLAFFGHMTQHLLVSLGAALLLVVGIPDWLSRTIFLHKGVAPVWRWLSEPFVASVLFLLNLWLWHAPPALNFMMSNHYAHLTAQLLFLVTAFIFWWPLFGTELEGMRQLNLAGKLICILISDMPMVVLGAGLTFNSALYDVYINMNPRPWGLSATADQQIGGLLMWIPGGIYFIFLASIIFLKYMLKQEHRQNVETARLALLEEELALEK